MYEIGFKRLIKSDLRRLGGGNRFLFNIHIKFALLFRLGSWLQRQNFLYKPLYFIVHCIYHHYQYKMGVLLRLGTKIGPGFKIAHA